MPAVIAIRNDNAPTQCGTTCTDSAPETSRTLAIASGQSRVAMSSMV
jgi:hypothetical protein